MDRRHALKWSAVGMAAACSQPLEIALAANLESRWELAVQQYSFNRQLRSGQLDILDFPKTVVRGTGIRALEFFNGHFEDKVGDADFFRQLRDRCDAQQATVTLMLCRGKLAIDSPDQSVRRDAIAQYRPWLDATRTLGGQHIRVDVKHGGDFEEQKRHAVAGLQALCDVAASDYGLGILVENHGGFSGNGAWVADVMRRVDRDNCGTLPDFQNFKEYDPYRGVAEMMPFAKVVCAKAKAFDTEGNEVNVDFRKMLRIVHDSGFAGSIGIEFEGHDVDPVTGILATKRLIERIAAELG